MPITKNDVKNISKLACIRLEDDKVEPMVTELNTIMDWIEKLREVDVSGIDLHKKETASIPERQDKSTEGNKAPQVLANAPDKIEDWFAVPKMIN